MRHKSCDLIDKKKLKMIENHAKRMALCLSAVSYFRSSNSDDPIAVSIQAAKVEVKRNGFPRSELPGWLTLAKTDPSKTITECLNKMNSVLQSANEKFYKPEFLNMVQAPVFAAHLKSIRIKDQPLSQEQRGFVEDVGYDGLVGSQLRWFFQQVRSGDMEKEAPALFGLLLARAQYSKKVARGQDKMQGIWLSKALIRFLFGLRRDKEACARRFSKQMIGYEVTRFPIRCEVKRMFGQKGFIEISSPTEMELDKNIQFTIKAILTGLAEEPNIEDDDPKMPDVMVIDDDELPGHLPAPITYPNGRDSTGRPIVSIAVDSTLVPQLPSFCQRRHCWEAVMKLTKPRCQLLPARQ